MMRLIDEARSWHKFASVRLAALAGVLAAYLAANPDVTNELLGLLPDGPMRTLAAVGIGLFVFSMATSARLVTTGKRPSEGE